MDSFKIHKSKVPRPSTDTVQTDPLINPMSRKDYEEMVKKWLDKEQ